MKITGRKIVSVLSTEFVYGGHLLSLGATGIVLSIILLFHLPINFWVLLIPYLSSQVVYVYNHFKELDQDIESNPERAQHLQSQRKLMGVLLSLYIVFLFVPLLFTNVPTFLYVSSVVLAGVLYTLHFKKVHLPFMIGFKNVYTSMFWALTVLMVPLFYELTITYTYAFLGVFVFLRWIVNSAFFDIKDIQSDSKQNVPTLPVLLGKGKTMCLLHVVNALSVLPLFIGYQTSYLPVEALGLAITGVYGLYYLTHAFFLKEKALRTLSYIVVDAEYIFWPLCILIVQLIV